MSGSAAFPWECRDKEDESRHTYFHPLRRSNQMLAEENLRLKRILRENGIAWSPIAQTYLNRKGSAKRTRRSLGVEVSGRPRLPTEVLLRILKYAMESRYPIIDPLSRLVPENLTEEERKRGNQIAIHFLATCRALHSEGTRYLWESNTFTFTTPQALAHFSELDAEYRQRITRIDLRVIARFYDDQHRKHRLERSYHKDLKKDVCLKVQIRPKDSPLVRGGFRCYTWNQLIDFLSALRAPYDPLYRDKKNPRPKLLPSLSVMRVDFVNFSESLIPWSGSELHEITSHELGCTLNELQVTGMPLYDAGLKASAELTGLLKDEGLYLDAPPSFVARSRHLQPLSEEKWCSRVIRAWKGTPEPSDDGFVEDADEDEELQIHYTSFHPRLGALPAAPAEEGHPPSTRRESKVIWKKVPVSRDESQRQWVQFSRMTGYEIDDLDWATDSEDRVCPCCGDLHPGSSFLEFLEDIDGDGDEDYDEEAESIDDVDADEDAEVDVDDDDDDEDLF